MDEDRLAAALRGATDDVQVPRDLVRHAERLGRARRSRRRSAATTLVVGVVVLAGGALVVPQTGSGGSGSASSTAGSADSAAAGAGSTASSAAPAPPAPRSAPQPLQDSSPDAESRGAVGESAACDPSLVVNGVPARDGYAAPVRAGERLEVTGPPRCGPPPSGLRYVLVLVSRGSRTPTVLIGVLPADDGSFSARVTVPVSTPPGPARLSAVRSARELRPCQDAADCSRPAYGADVEVLPAAS